jgi:hypothetical protein
MSPGVRSPVRESRVGRTRSAAAAADAADAGVDATGALGEGVLGGLATGPPGAGAGRGGAAEGAGAVAVAVGAAAGALATAGAGAAAGVGLVAATVGGGVVGAGWDAGGAPLVLAVAAAAPPEPLAPIAFRAASSSTEDAAALTSMPAAWSFSSTSLLESPCSLASSCTRFLLMSSPILRAWGQQLPSSAAHARSRRGAWRAPDSRPKAARETRPRTDRRRARAWWRHDRRQRAAVEQRRRPRRRCAGAPTSARFARSRHSGVGACDALCRLLLDRVDRVGRGLGRLLRRLLR